jgi:uncharacterized membrane protein
VGTAALATSLDLLLDCYGLDQGLWEWPRGGAYARELSGPNGRRGIPASNFVAWLAMTGAIGLGYLLATRTWDAPAGAAEAHGALGRHAGSLLLLPYYLLGVGWAVRTGHRRYLLYSGLVPLVALLGLGADRWPGHRVPRALRP